MRALYPLASYPASFDIFHWLVEHKARSGLTHVVFDTRSPAGKWSAEKIARRMESILIPAAELCGVGTSLGTDGELIGRPYGLGFTKWLREGGRFERVKTIRPAGAEQFTVTLRKADLDPTRDSDQTVWRAFAAEIGAAVIEDYDAQPIHLHDRFALYAGARMNYGVGNGPPAAITFSRYPVAMFSMEESCRVYPKTWQMMEGGKLVWMLPNQHFELETPTVASLLKFHGRVLAGEFDRWDGATS